MISKFIKFLRDNYSKTISEISKPSKNGKFIENDFMMISMDDIARDFAKKNSLGDVKNIPHTVDALYVSKNYNIFFLIEFKKIKLEDSDLPITAPFLKKIREKTPVDEYMRLSNFYIDFCNFLGLSSSFADFDKSDYYNDVCAVKKLNVFLRAYNKSERYLDDKTKNTLKIKPLSTLIILRQIFYQFREFEILKSEGKINSNEKFKINEIYKKVFAEDADTSVSFSSIKFCYFVVYEKGFVETPTPDIFNKHRDMKQYFGFFKNLKPYPISVTNYSNNEDFTNLILPGIAEKK